MQRDDAPSWLTVFDDVVKIGDDVALYPGPETIGQIVAADELGPRVLVTRIWARNGSCRRLG